MKEIFDLVNEMSPYLLLGFMLSGLMHAFIPTGVYHRYLGQPTFRSVLNATLLGIPIPLCSCGVIPTAMSLYRQGASKGAGVSFLIATPQTGIDSIIATYSLMGLPFALLRPIAALVTSVLGGQLVNLLDHHIPTAPASTTEAQAQPTPHPPHTSLAGRLKKALHYAFVEMMQDIGRWLILGLIVAGLITLFVPDSFFALFSHHTLLSIALVLLCAIPMYLCATGSIPIAVALMMKGLSPGAALVLLMAGPAVNMASMLVIRKVMGVRTLVLYLASIIGGATAFALIIDYLLPREWFTAHLEAIQQCCGHDETSYFRIGCTVLFLALLANALVRRYFHKRSCSCHHKGCHHEETPTCSGKTGTAYILHITGMSCNHCRANVEQAIAALPGVESVTVDLPTSQAIIKGSATPEAIRHAVESIGFGTEEITPYSDKQG